MQVKGQEEKVGKLPEGRAELTVEVREALGAAQVASPDVDLTAAWDGIVASELPSIHVRDVVELTQDCCVALTGLQLQRRLGDYPYYDRGNSVAFVDDYSLDGDHLLACCVGTISTRRGTLFLLETHERCMPSKSFICITPKDAADFEYLKLVLGNLAVSSVAGGCREALTVSEGSLAAQLIPWPAPEVRDRLVGFFNACIAAGLVDLADKAVHAFIYGHSLASAILDVPVDDVVPAFEPEPEVDEDSFVELATRSMDVLFGQNTDVIDAISWTPSLEVPSTMEPGKFVTCFPRNVEPQWTSRRVDENDPRWTLGVPPRNDAAYAWLQQALALAVDGGRVLTLMPNHVLHSSVGRMLDLRNSLAQSGYLRAVVALPCGVKEGEIFANDSQSLLVLEKGEKPFDVLMADARFLGMDCGRKKDGTYRRKLAQGSIDYLTGKLLALLEGGSPIDDEHCRLVALSDIAARDNVLMPWSFLA